MHNCRVAALGGSLMLIRSDILKWEYGNKEIFKRDGQVPIAV